MVQRGEWLVPEHRHVGVMCGVGERALEARAGRDDARRLGRREEFDRGEVHGRIARGPKIGKRAGQRCDRRSLEHAVARRSVQLVAQIFCHRSPF